MSIDLPVSHTEIETEPTSLWRDAWRRLYRNKLAVAGLITIILLVLIAIFGPYLSPYDFLSQSVDTRNQPPSSAHWFGTDGLGRDVLSRLIYGARTALLVAFIVTGVALVIGIIAGAIAGFAGGWVDRFLMWLTDVTMSIPSLLLVIVINASLKPPLVRLMDDLYQQTLNPLFRDPTWIDFILVFGSMALITWPPYARLVRAQVLSIRSRPYVLAARALGLSNGIILRRHVMPNALGPLIVAVSAGLGTAMVLESAFSFLGVGIMPPTPSWGNMIQEGLRVWRHHPYLLAGPAGVLGVATVAFSFLGDGLNDALNPRGAK
jgi:peptide/nickel transport system permease protein